jgi:mono/diheme cytochrome c family protein
MNASPSVFPLVVMTVVLAVALPAPIPARGESAQPNGSETPQASLPKPLVIPPEARKRENPVPKVPEAIEAGRSLFVTQCAMCHGENGRGKGELAASLNMKVPDMTDPKLQQKRTDGDLFYIISTGHGQMPGEKRLPEQNLWEMIHFIRTLKR